MAHLGVEGKIIEWSKSYLSNREHRTLVNNTLSKPLTAKTGVPQGSSLGPLLFLIYINDIKNIFDANEINIFADDSALILRNKHFYQLFNKANHKMILLNKFLKSNGIKLNESKTEYMIVSPNRPVPKHNMKLIYNGKTINEVKHIKLLGINIDNRLSFSNHTENLICNRLKKYVPILLKLRKLLPVRHLLKVYHANINSLISYCILVYHTGNSTNTNKVRRMQFRILKILFKTNSTELDAYMKQFNILDVTDTYIYKLLCIGHKMIYNNLSLPDFLHNMYQCKMNLNLRNNTDFIIPFHRITIAQNSLDYRIPWVWNKLPPELKRITQYNSFVKEVKKIIINGYYRDKFVK